MIAGARPPRSPRITYSPELPISAHVGEIAAAIARHQVLIVCGETGSGKSTQLPKICLEIGRGARAAIAHTQPRRLAARAIAARVAEELGVALGREVGYRIRFDDRTAEDTLVTVMTDGVLLEEIRTDPRLSAYDTLIVDEAHERSLNIDLLLGLTRRILPARPDFRLIVTSATLDPARFSRFFGGAPVLEVSGRGYPVEVRYRARASDDAEEPGEELDAGPIVEAVEELRREQSGDILVFLPTERDIRETAARLRRHVPADVEILPLYARLDAAGQDRIFTPQAQPRIVLATNVAETSLTVPRIHCVVDTGLARVSRYSARAKVQRLPIERISRASADQRAGRCGRLRAGVCLRLYSREDYDARPAFTEPEILRTSLAAVILRLLAHRLGPIERFPFIDAPDSRYVNDGFKLLEELGAVDRSRRLTAVGAEMSRLPVDPRIARMLIAARDVGSLDEVLVIAAALSVQDPRERPHGAQSQADRAHARYADPSSDFLWYLNLWRVLNPRGKRAGSLRRFCRVNHLSRRRVIEWRDTWEQLRSLTEALGYPVNPAPASYKATHLAVLAGLLGNIGVREQARDYRGARGAVFRIFPGSALARHPPRWLVAFELTETTRLYARTVARIAPAWVAEVAGDLLARAVFDARWDEANGRVVATERLSLYGLTVCPARLIDFSRADRAAAREIFIRAALVDGAFEDDAEWLRHNRNLAADIQALEHRARRRDILIGEDARFALYDRCVPADVSCRRSFRRWSRGLSREEARMLRFDRAQLLRPGAPALAVERFPARLEVNGMTLPLSYHFGPGDEHDGVTVDVPLAGVKQIDARAFEWLVPGLLEEKIEALLRGLPKPLRRELAPIGARAREAVRVLNPAGGALCDGLAAHLLATTGALIGAQDWNAGLLPAHLRMRVRILDEGGAVIAAGRDFEQLRAGLRGRAEREFSEAIDWPIERRHATCWDFGEVPERIESGAQRIVGFPAIVDCLDSVRIEVFDSPARARRESRAGLRRLVRLELPEPIKYLSRRLPDFARLSLAFAPIGGAQALRDDMVVAVIDRAFLGNGEPIRGRDAFEQACERGRSRMMDEAEAVAVVAGRILDLRHGIAERLRAVNGASRAAAIADIEQQLGRMVCPGFLSATPPLWLERLPRYLEAIRRRIDKLELYPGRDRARLADIAMLESRAAGRAARVDADTPALVEFRWLLEELRVSLFAQELGTAVPVSRQRLERLLESMPG
jgi:ATP-dependent helicase HrpA